MDELMKQARERQLLGFMAKEWTQTPNCIHRNDYWWFHGTWQGAAYPPMIVQNIVGDQLWNVMGNTAVRSELDGWFIPVAMPPRRRL